MISKGKISRLLKSLTLVIGLITASVSLFEYGIEDRIEKEFAIDHQKDDNSDDQSESNDPFYLPDYQATISSFQLHIDQVPKINDQIDFITIVRKWYRNISYITDYDFFKTLFQHIISPNAP